VACSPRGADVVTEVVMDVLTDVVTEVVVDVAAARQTSMVVEPRISGRS
jgi:hypothetical protein